MNYIFLMCSERSGSNLITKLFDSHPEICGPSTSHIADVIVPNLYRYNDLSIKEGQQLVDDVFELMENKNSLWEKRFSREELYRVVEREGFSGLFGYIYSEEARKNHKKSIFIKENRIYEFLPFIMRSMPACRYVYMFRDPRDMSSSWKHSFAIRGGVMRAANVWLKDQIGFLQGRSWLGPEGIPMFRYEDLINSPAEILTKVCERLGYTYDSAMLDFHRKISTQENASRAADLKNIGVPLKSDNAGKYRSHLTVDEIRYVESLCWDLMEVFGYKPDYAKLDNEEFQELAEVLGPLEPELKPAYQTVSESEKVRREAHYRRSRLVANRAFTVTNGLIR